MIIRNAVEEDIPAINKIYNIARQFMRDNGNKKQWINGYPSEDLLKNDIKENNLYVCDEKYFETAINLIKKKINNPVRVIT